MRKSLAIVCLILAVHITGQAHAHAQAPAQPQSDIRREQQASLDKRTYSNWEEAMSNYDYKAAITMLDIKTDSLKRSLELQQDSISASHGYSELKNLLLQKASCQKNLYNFYEAIDTLDEALQIWGEDPVIYANIAECHRLSGNDIAAFMFYDNAVRLSPDNLFLRIQKMMLEYKMEEYGNCLADGRHILKKDTIPAILITMGNCFNKTNRSDSALVYYGKAYGMNPYDYRTLEKISNIYLGRAMYDTVLAMSNNYLERDSANYVIAPIKGLAQYGLKDYKESYETFKKSLEYGCDELSGYWYLGLCRFMEKDWASACGWFNKASKLDTTDVNLVYYQAVCYANYPGKYTSEAEKYFTKAEAMIQPDSTLMYKINSSRAEMYLKGEEFRRAVSHFKAAQRYDTLQPAQLAQFGYAYRLLKDYSNAMKCYEEYFKVGKEGSSTWRFVKEEVAFIKEEQFMQEF